MRASTKICLAIGVLFALASLAWMVLLPRFVERELRATTGFGIHVAVLKADPFTGSVLVEGLSARNPPAYPDPDFVDVRELRADVNVLSWFFSDRFVINELDVDTAKVALIRRHDGQSNAGEFMSGFSGAATAGRRPRRYLIKRLHIKLEELFVADYTGLAKDRKTYKLNIDQTYNDVTDPRQLLVPEVVKTLYAFGFHHDIAKLLPGEFGQALAGMVGGAAQVGSLLKDAAQKTGQTLKGTIDKLEQSPKP